MTPELKPCPFCGGKPYLANVEMAGCSYVVCTDCRTQSDDMSKERAITQWNTRADIAAAMVAAERALWVQAIEHYFDGSAVSDVERHVEQLRNRGKS
jgi:Lar family restriction alleviation protein